MFYEELPSVAMNTSCMLHIQIKNTLQGPVGAQTKKQEDNCKGHFSRCSSCQGGGLAVGGPGWREWEKGKSY